MTSPSGQINNVVGKRGVVSVLYEQEMELDLEFKKEGSGLLGKWWSWI